MRKSSLRRSTLTSSEFISASSTGPHSFHSLTTLPRAYAASHSSPVDISSALSRVQSVAFIVPWIHRSAPRTDLAFRQSSRSSELPPLAPPRRRLRAASLSMKPRDASLTRSRMSSSTRSFVGTTLMYRCLSSTKSTGSVRLLLDVEGASPSSSRICRMPFARSRTSSSEVGSPVPVCDHLLTVA